MLLDGHSLAYRAFYALPPDLRTTSGQVTNAVYGFTSMLIKAMQDFKTARVVVSFDRGAPTERLLIRPEYKAQRETAPDEFRQQVDLIREVLRVLKIQVFEIDNVEADDIIHVLGRKLADEGHDAIIVTADRDFFQMVGPKVKLLMNRRGISETVVYDVAGVRERFGFGPEQYLEYAALRGDPSDNIAGVAGVGEKTAARLVQEHGTLEEIFKHLDQLTPRIRQNLGEAQERLLENRDFFRLRTADELAASGVDITAIDVDLDALQAGPWDWQEIRKLFDALEFRTLYDRLVETFPEAAPVDPGFEVEAHEVSEEADLVRLASDLKDAQVIVLKVSGDPLRERDAPDAIAFAVDNSARTVRIGEPLTRDKVWKKLAPVLKKGRVATHGSKEVLQRLSEVGAEPAEVVMDTEVAAYLIDPARGSYGLDELARQYLQRELRIERPNEEASGQGSLLEAGGEGDGDSLGLQASAVGELTEVLEKELHNRGAWDLFHDLELPLAGVLAKMERAGVKIDREYLASLSSSISDELRSIEEDLYRHAGGPFNIGSPPQLREVLYDRLGLKPTKKTKTGYSTDATVLETLRDEHPIVDGILRYREKSKLKSTYLDALPPLVDPRTGRLHCRFNQTSTATGRLSSDRPNLQNIPIRTEEGRQIRRAFIPEDGYVLLKADYSQIELRILAHLSGDVELSSAFQRGDDIHRLSISKALGIDPSEVTPELRSIGKMVSYGVTYGMGPFGLSQRLKIPVDQARTYIDGFFSLYPRVREYLDEVVEQATGDGFTTTMLGRRRYLPELKARNPRVRSLGERMALNAPIQGSAADIMKLAMVRVDEVLRDPSRMILTVHDELVFEVVEAEAPVVAGEVKKAMEGCLDLNVPLEVDVAWGPNWSDTKKMSQAAGPK